MTSFAQGLVVESTLERIKTEWACSDVEWVKENHWLKFCGMQLQWKDGSLMLGQPDFARELVERHGSVMGRSFPLPKVDQLLEPEEVIDPTDVKRCQQVMGELL